MMPSTSRGASPASASARSIACAAISFVVRPDAFVWSASPTPAIATSPETSSRSDGKPQSGAPTLISAVGYHRTGGSARRWDREGRRARAGRGGRRSLAHGEGEGRATGRFQGWAAGRPEGGDPRGGAEARPDTRSEDRAEPRRRPAGGRRAPEPDAPAADGGPRRLHGARAPRRGRGARRSVQRRARI